ncbi:MAG: pyridoxamine 5'-phosphate oxidase [Dokdonella sp.]
MKNATDSLLQEAMQTFVELLDEAKASIDPEPTAMTLSTADGNGRVSARVVLLKGHDEDGFRFFTNRTSAKGRQLGAHHQAALCFHWKQLRDGVQVRVEGTVAELPDPDSDAYFATRPRGSQLGAWASLQSQPLPDRETFEQRLAEFDAKFDGSEVPRPPHWGGYLLTPDRIEIWYGARYRLHERWQYTRDGDVWSKQMLYP